jgi:signal peptidase I
VLTIGRHGGKAFLAAGVAAMAVAVPYRPLVFVGHSMSPAYPHHAVALTLPFDGQLSPGDVVVLNIGGRRIVKRVAFVPGGRVLQFRTRAGWVDAVDYRLSDSHLRKMKTRYLRVPGDKVYVLGDHSVDSVDSRQLGLLDVRQIERIVVNPKPLELPPSPNLPYSNRTW